MCYAWMVLKRSFKNRPQNYTINCNYFFFSFSPKQGWLFNQPTNFLPTILASFVERSVEGWYTALAGSLRGYVPGIGITQLTYRRCTNTTASYQWKGNEERWLGQIFCIDFLGGAWLGWICYWIVKNDSGFVLNRRDKLMGLKLLNASKTLKLKGLKVINAKADIGSN